VAGSGRRSRVGARPDRALRWCTEYPVLVPVGGAAHHRVRWRSPLGRSGGPL